MAASVNHGNFASMGSSVNRRASVASTHSLTQSPSMGFRSFFGKKHAPSPLSTPSLNTASVFSTPTTPGSPAAQDQTDPLSSPMTTSVSQFSMLSLSSPQPMPVYGSDKSADAGDEVRFVVELTRVKNLDRLYCVDLKRMKGGPWSFKHVVSRIVSLFCARLDREIDGFASSCSTTNSSIRSNSAQSSDPSNPLIDLSFLLLLYVPARSPYPCLPHSPMFIVVFRFCLPVRNRSSPFASFFCSAFHIPYVLPVYLLPAEYTLGRGLA